MDMGPRRKYYSCWSSKAPIEKGWVGVNWYLEADSDVEGIDWN